ncbi:hypothetical protein [Clostridium estertheticum]|uniref:Uncharacterized protein n=1 Tax=Clostridium estertheticum TaxID=238834 RepID=A0AA47EK04_9CLOT|nr:hypothetical protein [Clostridium estertheticum]MBU3153910.1 hypothetical protein [Clostridium estertheticum]WAG61316.1 hypothetical protein LL038_03420 [Clostridium estertheticum]
MRRNKYNSFFNKYRLKHKKDNEYGENYDFIKEAYTKKLGIELNKKYVESEYVKIYENIKYEKIKVEGLLEKSKEIQTTINGVVTPLAVVAFVAEATFYQEQGQAGLIIFVCFISIVMLSQFVLSMQRAKENYVYITILQVLDDIVKEISESKISNINNISEQEVASAIETNCESIEDPIESINKTEKRRMKKYSKLFAKQFNVKIKDYSADSYDTLIKDIESKYSDMIKVDKNKLFNERVKAQDNINNCIRVDVSSSVGAFISAFVALALKNTLEFSKLFTILVFVALFIISQMFTALIDSLEEKTIKSYNNICLSILQKIENELE